MMLYKNTKAIIHSPDGKNDFFDIVTEVMEGDATVPCMFIISWNYVLWPSINLIIEEEPVV